ncbi:MAG: flagellar biosynthesis anti-sigma factor FlgM [Dehalococcoidia bacterium]
MPDEQDPTTARGRKRAGDGTSRQAPREGRASRDEPVDFQAAAARLSARAAQISRLKAEVNTGAYSADADETARAMERRSDT